MVSCWRPNWFEASKNINTTTTKTTTTIRLSPPERQFETNRFWSVASSSTKWPHDDYSGCIHRDCRVCRKCVVARPKSCANRLWFACFGPNESASQCIARRTSTRSRLVVAPSRPLIAARRPQRLMDGPMIMVHCAPPNDKARRPNASRRASSRASFARRPPAAFERLYLGSVSRLCGSARRSHRSEADSAPQWPVSGVGIFDFGRPKSARQAARLARLASSRPRAASWPRLAARGRPMLACAYAN